METSKKIRHLKKSLEEMVGYGHGKVSDAEKKIIVEFYPLCNGNSEEASKHIYRSPPTIRKFWREANLEIHSPKLTKVQKREVSRLYKTYKGNASKASRNSNYSSTTIMKYWRLNNLDPKGKGGRKPLSEEEKKLIGSYYEKADGYALRAAKNLPYSPPTILKYWKKLGYKIKKTYYERGLSDSEIKRIIKVFKKHGMNASKAEEDLPYCKTTILKYCKNAGLKPLKRGKH